MGVNLTFYLSMVFIDTECKVKYKLPYNHSHNNNPLVMNTMFTLSHDYIEPLEIFYRIFFFFNKSNLIL